jgi:hypothetical protein
LSCLQFFLITKYRGSKPVKRRRINTNINLVYFICLSFISSFLPTLYILKII